jgi:hypothetical protein
MLMPIPDSAGASPGTFLLAPPRALWANASAPDPPLSNSGPGADRCNAVERRRMTCPPTTTGLLDTLADLDGEELACLGLRRANDFMDAFSDLNKQAKEQAWERYAAPPRRQRKPRQPTLASVAKQAGKGGIEVARYEVKPDGTVVIVTGTPEPAAPDNPWPLDEFRTKDTKQ